MANTPNQNYPKPVATNNLSDDVTVLQTAFDKVDLDVKSLLTAMDTKSATGHGHVVADVAGLQGALDGKAPTGHTHALDDLTDVDGAAGAADGMLLQKTPVGFVPVSVSAAVGTVVTGLVDAGLAAKMDKSANLGDVVASAARTNIGAANIAGDSFTGAVSQPNLPAFHVQQAAFTMSGASGHMIGSTGLSTVYTDLNQGSHFDTSNGRFTVPVGWAGVYEFSGGFHQNTGSSANPYAYFIVNSLNYGGIMYGYYNIWQYTGKPTRIRLEEGDYVRFGTYRSGVSVSGAQFSGHFLG